MIRGAMNEGQRQRSLNIVLSFCHLLQQQPDHLGSLKELIFILIIMRTKSGYLLLPSCFTEIKISLNQPQFTFIEDICERDHWSKNTCCFLFLGLYPRHMEVPRLGVKLELQLLAYTTATATPDLSHICDPYHSSWQHWILNSLSKARDQICILIDTSPICFH